MQEEQLTVKQTATGYWVVQRGAIELVGALTREAAEAQCELLRRLGNRASGARARPARAVLTEQPPGAAPRPAGEA